MAPTAIAPEQGQHAPVCWVCGSRDLHLAKRGNLPDALTPEAFQITSDDYGRTSDVFRCEACGFLECPNLPDVLPYYVDMDDEDYEATRAGRTRRARRLLHSVAEIKRSGRLLDVGAGSGILVREALDCGYLAEGIEPSTALHGRAAKLGLPVYSGVLPNPNVPGPYDVVTLVDVIEHVSDPVGLLRNVTDVMAADGVILIVVPDVRSLAARLMGWRWWHYRIAHIGYFDRTTLARAASAAGLRLVKIERPGWYFPANYLARRALSYVPRGLQPPVPRFLQRIVVPLNLFDSLLAVCQVSPEGPRIVGESVR